MRVSAAFAILFCSAILWISRACLAADLARGDREPYATRGYVVVALVDQLGAHSVLEWRSESNSAATRCESGFRTPKARASKDTPKADRIQARLLRSERLGAVSPSYGYETQLFLHARSAVVRDARLQPLPPRWGIPAINLPATTSRYSSDMAAAALSAQSTI
jgi:hypothetical protein